MSNDAGFTIKGVVEKITPIATYGSNGFQKRTLVLEDTESKYPQYLEFTCNGKYADLPERVGIQAGDQVSISFWIRSREWQGRYYTELTASNIELIAKAPTKAPEEANKPYTKEQMEQLPF